MSETTPIERLEAIRDRIERSTEAAQHWRDQAPALAAAVAEAATAAGPERTPEAMREQRRVNLAVTGIDLAARDRLGERIEFAVPDAPWLVRVVFPSEGFGERLDAAVRSRR